MTATATPTPGPTTTTRPPCSIENECALLGAIILDWRVTGEVVQILAGPEDFYLAKHHRIYETLVEMYDANLPIELPQLKQRLEDLGVLDQVGGVEYLLELAEAVPSAASSTYYANIVRDKSMLRSLMQVAHQVHDAVTTSSASAQEQIDEAEQAIFKIAECTVASESVSMKDLLHTEYERLEAQEGRSVTGIETGFIDLDALTCGMQGGDMIIIAARPSIGKTALALNIAENVGATTKKPVAVFSMEMGKEQLGRRLMCSRSNVDSHKLRRNMLSSDDFAKLSLAVGELADAPIYIDDTAGLTPLTLRAKARRLAAKHDIQLVVIDYLQLMYMHRSESRQQEVTAISRQVKALARELSVPVICLSQLNRAPDNRENHQPRLSDLRESGSIEQDADVVIMLHREDYYHQAEADYTPTNTADLIIAKQRNGPTGTVTLHFNREATRFENAAVTYQGALK